MKKDELTTDTREIQRIIRTTTGSYTPTSILHYMTKSKPVTATEHSLKVRPS